MIEIRRLPILQSVLGAGLVVAACGGGGTDADVADPVQQEDGVLRGASESVDAKSRTLSAKQSAPTEVEHCNYGDAWHCMSAQQGWRWVHVRRRPGRGPVSGPGDLPAGTGERCCVLVGPRQPPRPEGT